jgi:hypothetical protein
MCPLCIGTATLLVSSGTSAGGLAALILRRAGKKLEKLSLAGTMEFEFIQLGPMKPLGLLLGEPKKPA